MRGLLALALVAGCASHEGAPGSEPTDDPAQLRASIASIELLEDCPDPAPEAEPDPESQARESEAKTSRPDLDRRASCTQSSVQLALSHDGTQPQRIDVVGVRLLRADTKESLATLRTRAPSRWNGQGVYKPWDQLVPKGDAIQVSYRMTAPDWNAVQQQLGEQSTYSQAYVVEIDLSMAGAVTTLRSTELSRIPDEVVET